MYIKENKSIVLKAKKIYKLVKGYLIKLKTNKVIKNVLIT